MRAPARRLASAVQDARRSARAGGGREPRKGHAMRKHLVLWVGVALLAASAAWAAEEETGRITSIDPTTNTFTIQTDDGDRIVYRAEPSTRMTRDGQTLSLSDRSVGARVQVTAPEAEGATQRSAREVELVEATGAGEPGARMGAEAGAGVRAGETGVGAGVGAEAGARAG